MADSDHVHDEAVVFDSVKYAIIALADAEFVVPRQADAVVRAGIVGKSGDTLIKMLPNERT